MADEFVITEEIAARVRADSARKAGKARLTSMTSEERKRIATLAAQARWAKKAGSTDPTDPKGPGHDREGGGSGIMSTRKPCRQTGIASQPTLFSISEPLHVRAA
jgi:hypothetical protein